LAKHVIVNHDIVEYRAVIPSAKQLKSDAIVMNLCINGLGVVRALGKQGIRVIGMHDGESPAPALYSKFLCDVIQYKGGDSERVDLLFRMGPTWKERPVLFPIGDMMVRCVADRLDELVRYYRIGLPPRELVEKMISKRGFASLAEELDLPLPDSLFVDEKGMIEDAAFRAKYPCIIKPEFRSTGFEATGSQKAYLVQDPEELIAAYYNFSDGEPRAIIQEWIPGGDGDIYFCLQCYARAGKLLGSFCGRKIRQWPPLSGGTASCEPVENPFLEELTTKFFSTFGFHGLCSMEFKRNVETNEYFLIEPTVGRTDWQSDVANANGVPLPYLSYCELAGLQIPEIQRARRKVRWVRWSADHASFEKYKAKGELSWFSWLHSIWGPVRWSVWSLTDAKPYVAGLWRKVYRKLKHVTKRI
jgi:predicted ATP-grasp superfamily ATP-dependent carboligase